MFTGIIEEIGIIKEFTKLHNGAKIIVECSTVLNGTKLGDSIAINGCCQTVTNLTQNSFTADVSNETLSVTNFSELKSGNKVNLERALTPSSRLGGHIVQGHIDCLGQFIKSEQLSNFYNLTFKLPENEMRYVVTKGSIAINGVSLTIAEIQGNTFKTAIIPHTLEKTTLRNLNPGDSVNIETDILGRYIEKFLSVNNNSNTISEDFLRENGFV